MDHLDIFQIIQTISRSSRHLADHLDSFQIIWILWISSGHFSNHPYTFTFIRILFRWSGHFAELPQIFILCGYSSDHLDSGFSQTFRSALLAGWRVFFTLHFSPAYTTGCLKKTEFYQIEHLQICHKYKKYFSSNGSRICKCSVR